MIVSYIFYTNHVGRPDIKGNICKINNFSIGTSICPKYTTKSYQKQFWKNLASVNLKLKK